MNRPGHLEHVGQPGVAHPRPPESQQGEHTPGEALPGDVVQHQVGDLRHRKHERQVEEQLQVAHRPPLRLLGYVGVGLAAGRSAGGVAVVDRHRRPAVMGDPPIRRTSGDVWLIALWVEGVLGPPTPERSHHREPVRGAGPWIHCTSPACRCRTGACFSRRSLRRRGTPASEADVTNFRGGIRPVSTSRAGIPESPAR